MNLKTEDLISSLTNQLKPVQIVRFNALDFFKAIAVGFICLFLAVLVLGFREDFREQISSPHYIFEGLILISLAVGSILAAFKLSIPASGNQKFYLFPVLAFGLILLSAVYGFFVHPEPSLYLGHGFACAAEITAISILPALAIFYFIRRGVALDRNKMGALVAVSAVSFGLLGVQLTCADSTPLHATFWHVFPAAAFIMLGLYLGQKIFRKI